MPSPVSILHVHSLPKTSVSSNTPPSNIFGLCDLKQVKISTTDVSLSYWKMHEFHLNTCIRLTIFTFMKSSSFIQQQFSKLFI